MEEDMKKLLVSILIMSSVVLYGCQNEAISEEDEAILEKNSVKKDLKWMEEMNEDTISSDAILQIREEGNLGPTVQYSKRMEDRKMKREESPYMFPFKEINSNLKLVLMHRMLTVLLENRSMKKNAKMS